MMWACARPRLTAFDDLWNAGGISSGAVMVPCPWFPSVAAYCRENPDVDMGIHATLNCEWDCFPLGRYLNLRSGIRPAGRERISASQIQKSTAAMVSSQ